ncbi:MAG: hypothetical protein AB1646_03565 [Thermodesulfobacteriota bacterium]
MERFFERLWDETGAVDLIRAIFTGVDHWVIVACLVVLGLVAVGGICALVRRAEKRHFQQRRSGEHR